MKQELLTDGWTLTAAAGPIPKELQNLRVPATVPGCVHTDLLAAGLIPDPYLDDNESALSWIGQTDWTYTGSFEWQPGEDHTELVFHGLDTIARISLNDEVVGNTRNMHRSYTFDVSRQVVPGTNIVTIDFSSPIRHADAASLELGARPHVNHHPYNAIRKMACSFGWDWGIDTATSGIWRPVVLRTWSMARFDGIRPVATVEQLTGAGEIEVHLNLKSSNADRLEITAHTSGHTAKLSFPGGPTSVVARLRLESPELWWPRGHGEQPLYDIELSLSSNGVELDTATTRVGFRTVELALTPDAEGTGVALLINQKPIFVHGANWIPDDAFPHRITRDRYRERLQQAAFANLNLLRVWGGGIYESEDFYGLCDEMGILTWQDFLLACAAYAEEDPLRSEIIAEARENVSRLASHPSLVILNGNNENVWGYDDWNWKLRLDGQTWGAGYYFEEFPRIVSELAPQIAYTPASPFSPSADQHPNDPAHGTTHQWEVWNRLDYLAYREDRPRFVSEFGWQGPPTWSTLTEALTDDPLTPESPGMVVHQKAIEGNDKLTNGLLRHFRLPNNMPDWHWAMSLNQAHAISTAVQYLRSLSPTCTGSIMWQLNDCWPVVSWAAVDGNARAKPLLYALRQAHAPRLLTIQPNPGGLQLAVVNDLDTPWEGEIRFERTHFDGSKLARSATPFCVNSRETLQIAIPDDLAEPHDPANEVLVVKVGDTRALWFFAEPRDSHLASARFTAELQQSDGGYQLHVTAQNLIRDLSLLVDKVDPAAIVDDMLITLLPGETTVLTITTSESMTLEALCSPKVLCSANQLVAERN